MSLFRIRNNGVLVDADSPAQRVALISGQGAPSGDPGLEGATYGIYFRENASAANAAFYITLNSGTAWTAFAATGAGGALTITDTPTYFTTDTVDGALDAIGVQIGGDTDATFNFTEANVVADNDAVYAALEKLDLKFGDLASTAPGEGANGVAVEDAAAYYAGATVEAVLTALGVQIGGTSDVAYAFTAQNVVADNDAIYAAIDKLDKEWGKRGGFAIADPGDGNPIPVTKSGLVALNIGAGVETNTLAIPTFIGQKLTIVSDVQGAGTRAITAASAINVATNTVMTFATLRQNVTLEAIQVGGVLAWEVVNNNGSVSLS